MLIQKRRYAWIVSSLVGSMATWASTPSERHVFIASLYHAQTRQDQILLIHPNHIVQPKLYTRLKQQLTTKKLLQDNMPLLFWNGERFDANIDTTKSYTQAYLDLLFDTKGLLKRKEKKLLAKQSKMGKALYLKVEQAWKDGDIFHLDPQSELVLSYKDDYFSDKAKVLTKDVQGGNMTQVPPKLSQGSTHLIPKVCLIDLYNLDTKRDRIFLIDRQCLLNATYREKMEKKLLKQKREKLLFWANEGFRAVNYNDYAKAFSFTKDNIASLQIIDDNTLAGRYKMHKDDYMKVRAAWNDAIYFPDAHGTIVGIPRLHHAKNKNKVPTSHVEGAETTTDHAKPTLARRLSGKEDEEPAQGGFANTAEDRLAGDAPLRQGSHDVMMLRYVGHDTRGNSLWTITTLSSAPLIMWFVLAKKPIRHTGSRKVRKHQKRIMQRNAKVLHTPST